VPEPHIIGIGYYVPETIVHNDDLSKIMDTSNEWIIERTGIQERRFAGPNEGPADLAIPAAEEAIANAMIKKEDVDFIIFATSTPDYYVPGSSCILQDKMGFDTIGALDIRVQCSGFIYGISIAEQYIKSGKFKNILVSNNIESAVIEGKVLKGFLIQPINNETDVDVIEYHTITVTLPEVSMELTELLDQYKVAYEFKEISFSFFDYLIQFSPWLIIIFFWFFSFIVIRARS